VDGRHGSERLIRPPAATLFSQVLAYLKTKPDPPTSVAVAPSDREGLAAAAVTLRWGSYLAVLLDHDKPFWSPIASPGTSRISDQEMARINIEASAALAEWIDLSRTDRPLYAQLVQRALCYLPMPQTKPKITVNHFAALADPEIADQLVRASNPAQLARVRGDAARHPSRLFANALLNIAWRNGPVENVHAGKTGAYPLGQRRVTLEEERTLMQFSSERLTLGMSVCRELAPSHDGRPWSDKVLPYGVAQNWSVTPLHWTLTEVSRKVRLPGGPAAAE
jgi:hypothetical protein